jgi:hypothetical protein
LERDERQGSSVLCGLRRREALFPVDALSSPWMWIRGTDLNVELDITDMMLTAAGTAAIQST